MYSPLDLNYKFARQKASNYKGFIFIALVFAVVIFIGTRGATSEFENENENSEFRNQNPRAEVYVRPVLEVQPEVVKPEDKVEVPASTSEASEASSPVSTSKENIELTPVFRGYTGPRHELDDVEWETDSKNVNSITKSLHEIYYSNPKCDYRSESETGKKIAKTALEGFQKCVKPIFDSFNEEYKEMFDNWVNSSRKCDFIDEYKDLDIKGIANRDEFKWLIYPKCQEHNTHVTLGVGNDIKAETKLKKHQPFTQFYGVDPIIDFNYELITNDLNGSFFAFALANETKIQYFPVLPKQGHYAKQAVATLDAGYFFEHLLKLKRIDTLFLDIEGGEQYFFDYFSKGGKFDEIGMSICQFNIEFHPGYTKNYDLVYKFLEQTIKDERFIFMRPAHHTPGFFKMYFLNVENQECITKFLSGSVKSNNYSN
ncbi:unnamed protein product [Caenorhabditis angaria]|uniref:Methyltransferase FkbM domain-containing protein n=1 Tax=Caenorhabditis angaria TaxID=860376 RepID=A0A9P1I6W5_9PELO|nr:unnamed protein product [Caenorhabditis angaria]